ncbi:hypothetical protein M0208_08640 [Sphingomonas sp. SUN019]|uniref:hypothetical protein n=1 Tax=Sphingomonas sp. SUN019 TaxID=2937788 RepID=UPI0021641271|nr:hypothetical protein [Sphingomonas sp. SUN019]UVO50579.1 hypothetical protein M0208_08640 [Sphingomonas sp. SUN019]
MSRAVLCVAALSLTAGAMAQVTPRATEVRRYPVPEARQGVSVDAARFYAIDNRTIAAYDRRSGRRVARWEGDPALFQHLNSCVVDAARLICAHSNYPRVPMASSIETFDARTLRHLSSHSLGPGTGSLTWIIRRDGYWWAGYANYDAKGGDAGRDHRATLLVRMDDAFVRQEAWLFPDSVLAAMKPYSSSGGVWGDDGLLYVTGHDAPEIYVVALPEAGSTLRHVATIPVATGGQAIAWDPAQPRTLWSISRSDASVVVSRLPVVGPRSIPDRRAAP